MVTAAFGSAHILFLSTPSARRATWYNYINKSTRPIISIHALREEGDGFCFWMLEHRIQFLSTPSARRATRPQRLRGHQRAISIHALREEGDQGRRDGDPFLLRISIHALREEGDSSRRSSNSSHRLFLSTPSARRATVWRPPRDPPRALFLSTPSARRATAKTETKSLFSNKLYNILHEFRRALIYNGSKNYPNHAK